MRSKSRVQVKAQSLGRLLGYQRFVCFPHTSCIIAHFLVLEWQVLGLQETSPHDTCIILKWKPGLRGQIIRGQSWKQPEFILFHPVGGWWRGGKAWHRPEELVPLRALPGSPKSLKFVLFSLRVPGDQGWMFLYLTWLLWSLLSVCLQVPCIYPYKFHPR